MAKELVLWRGDITRLEADGIVNAANTSMLGGGGVDGAIHRAAGPQLVEECRRVGRCPTGEARRTGAYRLKARFILHTVGPVWQDGMRGEPELLRRCYRSVLALARESGLRSLAVPSISTGAFGFPIARAAPIAVEELRRGLAEVETLERVTVALFSDEDLAAYRDALRET